MSETNPKDLVGINKVPTLSVIPSASLIYEALAMRDGAAKYGPMNWREKGVKASIYVDACLRHVMLWMDREECASDSGVPHLGHAKACLGILADAIEAGSLIDDRPAFPGAAAALLERWKRK